MVKNKSKITGVIAAAALIAFSATSCGSDITGGHIGDTLSLGGQVYILTQTESGNPVFNNINIWSPVAVTAYGSSVGGAVLGTGTISAAGRFRIDLTAPAAEALESASSLASAIYSNASVVPADTTVQGTLVRFSYLWEELERLYATATEENRVMYVFVNGPVTITIPQSSGGGVTTNAATLNLTAGWNAIYVRAVTTDGWDTYTNTYSVANPILRWVFDHRSW